MLINFCYCIFSLLNHLNDNIHNKITKLWIVFKTQAACLGFAWPCINQKNVVITELHAIYLLVPYIYDIVC